MAMGMFMSVTCDTIDGRQTFTTPSDPDSFHTPDGRLVPGRAAEETQEQYQMGIIQYLMASGKEVERTRLSLQSSRGALGDETADRITGLIGVNALSEDETRNVLAILRAAFEKPETIQPSAKYPSQSLRLLRHLAELTDQDSLRRQITETIAYLQAQ